MRIATSQIYQQAVNALMDRNRELAKTQEQIASGLRVTRPADDPAASARIIGLNDSLSRLDQYQRNADAAQTRLELADSALDEVDNGINRSLTLTIQGLDGALGPNDLKGIAVELREIQKGMLSLANRTDGSGDYLFAGSQSRSAPFVQGAGGVSFVGDQSVRELAISDTRQIRSGESGLDVFMKIPAAGGGYQDVFTTLDNIASDLETGNPPDPAELDNLNAALDNVLTARARVGARLNAIDTQRRVNDNLSLQDETTRSGLRDLDVVEAASRFSQQLTTLQAAQQSFVRIQGLSLFNYL